MPAEKVQVYVRMPRSLQKAAKACAASAGLTLNGWINLRVAQGVRNWSDPLGATGRAVAEAREEKWVGWFCTHGSHGEGIPAVDCPHREKVAHQKTMVNPDQGLYEGFTQEDSDG